MKLRALMADQQAAGIPVMKNHLDGNGRVPQGSIRFGTGLIIGRRSGRREMDVIAICGEEARGAIVHPGWVIDLTSRQGISVGGLAARGGL